MSNHCIVPMKLTEYCILTTSIFKRTKKKGERVPLHVCLQLENHFLFLEKVRNIQVGLGNGIILLCTRLLQS